MLDVNTQSKAFVCTAGSFLFFVFVVNVLAWDMFTSMIVWHAEKICYASLDPYTFRGTIDSLMDNCVRPLSISFTSPAARSIANSCDRLNRHLMRTYDHPHAYKHNSKYIRWCVIDITLCGVLKLLVHSMNNTHSRYQFNTGTNMQLLLRNGRYYITSSEFY